MTANALINDSRLCSQNGRVMRPREEATRAIQMIIIIINKCKCFSHGESALQQTIESGHITVLVEPNGAGKSSLLGGSRVTQPVWWSSSNRWDGLGEVDGSIPSSSTTPLSMVLRPPFQHPRTPVSVVMLWCLLCMVALDLHWSTVVSANSLKQ
jgi:hypothetical protein